MSNTTAATPDEIRRPANSEVNLDLDYIQGAALIVAGIAGGLADLASTLGETADHLGRVAATLLAQVNRAEGKP